MTIDTRLLKEYLTANKRKQVFSPILSGEKVRVLSVTRTGWTFSDKKAVHSLAFAAMTQEQVNNVLAPLP
jgi:hypothetical protein